MPALSHPGVVLDVLLELGHQFGSQGAPCLADGVQDVARGHLLATALEQDALEGQLRGAAGGEGPEFGKSNSTASKAQPGFKYGPMLPEPLMILRISVFWPTTKALAGMVKV